MTEDRPSPVLWQTCVIEQIVQQTPSIKSFFVQPSAPLRFIAGQHLDIRLTATDGYTAMRSYSIASSPSSASVIELAIERLPDGEVSPYFHDIAAVGDSIEIRGPLGGHFLWPDVASGTALFVGAGSGVVPLMAMLRHRYAFSKAVPAALLLSARTARDTLFLNELLSMERDDPTFHLAFATTRGTPPRDSDFSRRIDSEMVSAVVARLPRAPAHVFVCGSNAFVNVATDGALAAGVDADVIKTERYGG
jgi:ferredoxin-NADP reductase